jgi:hypothetical protein
MYYKMAAVDHTLSFRLTHLKALLGALLAQR